MTYLLPILLSVVFGYVMLRLSVARTRVALDARSRPLRDPEITERCDRLAHALDLPAIGVNVYDIDPVNGLADPDGRIFLTRGFLAKKAQGEVTADELAAVIAHELGHVALGHMRRRMIDFTGQNAVFAALTMLFARLVPVIGIWIANLLASALAARLSRRDEFEADAYASALLIKAGIGTGPQKSLFAKLERMTGAAGTGLPVWLLSHPPAAERIAAIEANEARWRGATP